VLFLSRRIGSFDKIYILESKQPDIMLVWVQRFWNQSVISFTFSLNSLRE
jgi:hypothetical protein